MHPLNVGFAVADLRKGPDSLGPLVARPEWELRVHALDGPWSAQGVLALRDFIDYMLNRPWAKEAGLLLTYDVTEVGMPQFDVIEDVLACVDEQPRRDLWRRRLACCRLVLSSDSYVRVVHAVLTGLCYVFPPACDTYLVTDASAPLSLADRIYQAPHIPSLAELSPKASEVAVTKVPKLRQIACLDGGFLTVEVGQETDTGMGYVRILASSGPLGLEQLNQVLDFVDAFTMTADCVQGWAMTYDLRALRVPTMTMIKKIAEWGNVPDRKARWEAGNKAAKVVIPPGYKLSVSKGLLAAFFVLCPPVCKVLLLTSPDQDEAKAIVFEPPPPKLKAGSRAGSKDSADPNGKSKHAKDGSSSEDDSEQASK